MNLKTHSSRALLALTFAFALAACSPQTPTACADCGSISSVKKMTAQGTGSGVGAVVGAVAGAVVGHQVGGGSGKDAATVAGAIGGGYAGNEIEKRAKGTIYYHVTIAMDDGSTRVIDVDTMNGLSNGSKVKVSGSSLRAG